MRTRFVVAAVVMLVFGMRATAAEQQVEVTNKSGKTIQVTVTSDVVHLVESVDGVKADREYEAHLKAANESKIGEGAASVSDKKELDIGTTVKTSDETHAERKYDWSPFTAAGEEKVPDGRTGKFSVQNNTGTYYLTVRFDDGFVCVNAPKSVARQAKMTVDAHGFIVPPEGRILQYDSKIVLKTGDKYMQDPVTSKSWPAGNLGSAPGVHYIDKKVDSKDASGKLLKSGDKVKIRCDRTPSGSDNYNRMYSSDKGWVYYDLDSDNLKQQWVLLKVRGSAADDMIRDGDVVRIRNVQFDQAYLKNYDGQWADCENGASDEWVITLSH